MKLKFTIFLLSLSCLYACSPEMAFQVLDYRPKSSLQVSHKGSLQIKCSSTQGVFFVLKKERSKETALAASKPANSSEAFTVRIP